MGFVIERQPGLIASHVLQLMGWVEFQKPDIQKFDKFYMWFHLRIYLEMYFNVPIVIYNFFDIEFIDTQDLKMLEFYEEIEKETTVVQIKTTFQVNKPIPVGFMVPI